MGVLEEKVELFSDRLITETLRQWIVLLISISLIILLSTAIFTMVRYYRRLFVADAIILSLIETRVLLIIVAEFIYPSRFIIFLSDMFHMLVLTVIFYMFTKKLLVEKEGFFSFYKIYVAAIAFILSILMLLAIIFYKQTFDCEDDDRLDNFAIFLLQALEFGLALLNLILTIIISRQLNRRINREMSTEESEIINNMLNQKADAQIKRYQISVLSRGLFVYTICFTILTMIGDFFVYHGRGFSCIESLFFQPQEHYSSIFMLSINITATVPPILLWYVIFYIPKKSGTFTIKAVMQRKLQLLDQTVGMGTIDIIDEDLKHITKPLINSFTEDNKDTDSIYVPSHKYISDAEIDRSSRKEEPYSDYKLSFEENMKNNFDSYVKFGKKRSDKGPKSKILSKSFYEQRE